MSELLEVWMVEGVLILTVLWPLGMIFGALHDLKEGQRRRREAGR